MARVAGHRTGVLARGRDVAVIQDTTEVYVGSKRASEAGFGPIGKGGALRGVLAHVAIAVDDTGGLIGLVDEMVWTRQGGQPVTDRKRKFEDKESYRWLKACEVASERLAGARSITMVSDAESDIFPVFARCPEGLHLLVRSAKTRSLLDGQRLADAAATLKNGGRVKRIIPAAPGRSERRAVLDVRYGELTLAPPHGTPDALIEPLTLTVLQVTELNAPQGVEPVNWTLITTHKITDLRRAEEILDLYRGRFLIEQLFRTLKTAGFDIENADINDPHAFITLTALAIIASVNILQLVKARDGDTGQILEDCFDPDDAPILRALSKKLEGKTDKQKNPHPLDQLAFASWVIARLGGWTGYYGKPGPKVMRQGLDKYFAIKCGSNLYGIV